MAGAPFSDKVLIATGQAGHHIKQGKCRHGQQSWIYHYFFSITVYYTIEASELAISNIVAALPLALPTMRYEDWDILLFPKDSKIPFKEFLTSCHVVNDVGKLLNLSLYRLLLSSVRVFSQSWGVRPAYCVLFYS